MRSVFSSYPLNRCPRFLTIILFVLLTLSAQNPVRAGDELDITIYSENDSPAYKPINSTDENRTNAAGISFSHEPKWAENISEYIPFSNSFGPANYGAGYVAGHLIFTPEDITISAPQPDDRPWASYVFAGVFWQRVRRDRSMMDHLQVDIGLVGPDSKGETFQKTVHDVLGSPDPEGWDNQIPNEVTGNLHMRRKWRLLGNSLETGGDFVQYDLIPQVGMSLGTVLREVRTTLVGRAGWKLPDDFGPGRLLNQADATGKYERGYSAYGFARLTGRAIQHEIFLDGTEFRDSAQVDREPFVGEIQLGAQFAYRSDTWNVKLGYGQTLISKQFEQQEDTHSFGTWTLSVEFEF